MISWRSPSFVFEDALEPISVDVIFGHIGDDGKEMSYGNAGGGKLEWRDALEYETRGYSFV